MEKIVMKIKSVLIPILMTLFVSTFTAIDNKGDNDKADWPVLKGPYLGQKPPGMTPEIFAPKIISSEYYEHGITFNRNGVELYFTRRITVDEGNRIFHAKVVNGKWTKPSLAPFASLFRESSPNFSPDEMQLFFNSRRPPPENIDSPHPLNVWMVRRKGSDWEEPEMIGSPVMQLFPMFVTQSRNRTIYFTGNVDRGIYKAEYRKGRYNSPERLPDVINSRNWTGHPFIDPEERYIIFDSNMDQKGRKNLYISFKDDKGDWMGSINMNKCFDFPEHGAIPHVSFNGKYLFFSSRGDIYWVDAKIIEELKPKNYK
jgi:hypothetical protein